MSINSTPSVVVPFLWVSRIRPSSSSSWAYVYVFLFISFHPFFPPLHLFVESHLLERMSYPVLLPCSNYVHQRAFLFHLFRYFFLCFVLRPAAPLHPSTYLHLKSYPSDILLSHRPCLRSVERSAPYQWLNHYFLDVHVCCAASLSSSIRPSYPVHAWASV